ncbi:hypothetical protein FF1_018011 [Malus domestica]
MHALEPRGISGELCVFWKDDSQVILVKSEDFVIEVRLWDENKKCHCCLFSIYANIDDKKRRDQWVCLSKQIEKDRDRSLIIGNFNDILCNEEKEGGNYRMTSSLRDFREFVARNEFMDIGYEGCPFTWRNNKEAIPIQ